MITRRAILALSLFGPLGTGAARAAQDPPRLAAEVALFAAGRPVETIAFGLTIPDSVESGYTVPAGVAAAGPLLGDGLRELRILAPQNPLVRVCTLAFGAMSAGGCDVRIRLARTQTVTALARTASGRVLREDRAVAVLVGGCGFDLESPT